MPFDAPVDEGFVPAGDMEDVLEALGLVVDEGRTDEDEVGVLDCPMHFKRKGRLNSVPKWSINRDSGYHHCYSCGYGGALVELVMDVTGKDVWQALTWLKSFGVDLDKLIESLNDDGRKEKELVVLDDDKLNDFEDPPAAALESRGMSLASARRYDVLWNPRRDSWITPIRLLDGTLLGYQEKAGGWVRNRPEDMEKSITLFGLDVFEGGTAILVESPLDVPHIFTAGVTGALASFGVEVSEAQMKLIVEVADRLVLALDNDGEGRRKTKELITGKKIKIGNDGVRREFSVTNWSKRITTTVWNYGSTKAKDPGEQDGAALRHSFDTAVHASIWRPLGTS